MHTHLHTYILYIYTYIYIYIQNEQPVEIIDEEHSLSVGPNTTSVVINNLQPGLSYDFKVH